MFFYCYVYVFLLSCMFCSVYSVFIVPTGTLRLPWLRFFCAFSSVLRQMPGYNSQRQGTARTLPKLIVLFWILFMCKCVLYFCHRVSTQLRLANIYIYISLHSAHKGGKFVSPKHRSSPPTPNPKQKSWYSFLLSAESTVGPQWC
jgi:hypothetical protein